MEFFNKDNDPISDHDLAILVKLGFTIWNKLRDAGLIKVIDEIEN